MRRIVAAACMLASLAAVPIAVNAASSLRGVMKTWRSEQRATEAMLSGRVAFDPEAIRQTLQRLADDAAQISARATAQTAEARDIRQRFAAFQAAATAAQADAEAPARLAQSFRRLTSDCQSCHDLYKD